MIVGMGTDIIEIERFSAWGAKSYKSLRRVFSHDEILYALSDPKKTAERLAVRFAVREAFYKASFALVPPMPFLSFCAAISVSSGAPRLTFPLPAEYRTHISLSHSRTHAIATVIIEKV